MSTAMLSGCILRNCCNFFANCSPRKHLNINIADRFLLIKMLFKEKIIMGKTYQIPAVEIKDFLQK